MLDPEYLKTVTEPLEEYFYELETAILCDIAERIRLNSGYMTSTADWQIRQAKELGITNERINKYLADALKKSEKDIEKIITSSAYKAVEADNLIFKKAVEAGFIEEFSDNKGILKKFIEYGIVLSSTDVRNICNTTARTSQNKLLQYLNEAFVQVQSGAFSSDQVVDNVVTKLSKDSLAWVDYASGAHRRPDSAVRQALRTSVNRTALKCQEANMDELGCNLVEVTSHMGARPSHAEWQGKIYWRKEPYKNYKNLEEATGYGRTDGLGGVNCRHSFYPFFPGISTRSFEHYNEKKNKELYELQQQQRYNERKIREWKRRQKVMEAAGCNSIKEKTKVREWTQKNKTFINSDDRLKRNYAREKSYTSMKNGKGDLSGLKVSGALDPTSKKANEHAVKYYESVRKMKTDYKKIAKNTGYSEKLIKKIKQYSFVDEHNLINGRKRFDPDYHMAQSWQRLIEGKNIQKHDLLLLEHEMYEIILVEDGMSQQEAHNHTNEIYNYRKGCDEYDGFFKKFYKK